MPHTQIAVIGGGPAGLRAAEIASAADVSVALFEAKRSVGRKFLVAGKGGFNLTHSESIEEFVTRYLGPEQPQDFWPKTIAGFDNQKVRGWAARMDVGTFVAKSGRVYPKALKAAPLLRRWVQRLRGQGVEFHVNHRLTGLTPGSPHELTFETAEGSQKHIADVVILALGGGSWPLTGSDGRWTSLVESLGISVSPLEAANCGWQVAWPAGFLETHEATPLKNLFLTVAEQTSRGELMITKYGLEGGPLYELGPPLRAMDQPIVTIDFKPTFTKEKLVAKMESAKRNFLHEAQLRWKLPVAVCDLVESSHGPIDSAAELAELVKAYPLALTGPRPLPEAISSAGGVRWSELTPSLMLRQYPGVFLAGEMIDWEAPTGGYLMQGCLSTGTLVGEAALSWLEDH